MKIYIAASYSRREEVAQYAELLKQDGHEITSRWLSGAHEHDGTDPSVWAAEDEEDVQAANCLLSFTEHADSPVIRMRGGRHVEFGMAVALGLWLVLIGPRENCFHHLPEVYQFDTLEAARETLIELGKEPILSDVQYDN